MFKFGRLTKYIPQIENGDFGHFLHDVPSEDSHRDPVTDPDFEPAQWVKDFVNDFNSLEILHYEYETKNYRKNLASNKCKMGCQKAYYTRATAKTAFNLIHYYIQEDTEKHKRLLGALMDGTILMLLDRLKHIDDVFAD